MLRRFCVVVVALTVAALFLTLYRRVYPMTSTGGAPPPEVSLGEAETQTRLTGRPVDPRDVRADVLSQQKRHGTAGLVSYAESVNAVATSNDTLSVGEVPVAAGNLPSSPVDASGGTAPEAFATLLLDMDILDDGASGVSHDVRQAIRSYPDHQAMAEALLAPLEEGMETQRKARYLSALIDVAHPRSLSLLAGRSYTAGDAEEAEAYLDLMASLKGHDVGWAFIALADEPNVPFEHLGDTLFEWSTRNADAIKSDGVFLEYLMDGCSGRSGALAALGTAACDAPYARATLEKVLAHTSDPAVRSNITFCLSLLTPSPAP